MKTNPYYTYYEQAIGAKANGEPVNSLKKVEDMCAEMIVGRFAYIEKQMLAHGYSVDTSEDGVIATKDNNVFHAYSRPPVRMNSAKHDMATDKYPMSAGGGIVPDNDQKIYDGDYDDSLLPQPSDEAVRTSQEVVARRKIPPDGRYTAVFADGTWRTIRFRTQPKDSHFAGGSTIVSYLYGSDNENSYKQIGFLNHETLSLRVWKKEAGEPGLDKIQDAVRIIVGDPEDAGMQYALKEGRCRVCSRTLTVPASIHRGMGPECAANAL